MPDPTKVATKAADEVSAPLTFARGPSCVVLLALLEYLPIGVFTPYDPGVFTRLSKLEKVSMIFLLDGCWLSAWGTVARSVSWQIGCSTTAITDQERKEQQMEQLSDLFGFSVVPATVARGTPASRNFPFPTSS